MSGELNRVIQFLNTAEGRDKSGKVIQYGSRFIQWHLKDSNKVLHESFKALFCKF
jgi:peroxin-11B